MLYIYLSIYLSICLSFCLCVCLSIYLSIYLSISLSIVQLHHATHTHSLSLSISYSARVRVFMCVCARVCVCVCLCVCVCVCVCKYITHSVPIQTTPHITPSPGNGSSQIPIKSWLTSDHPLSHDTGAASLLKTNNQIPDTIYHRQTPTWHCQLPDTYLCMGTIFAQQGVAKTRRNQIRFLNAVVNKIL